jgi:hypothetical protein
MYTLTGQVLKLRYVSHSGAPKRILIEDIGQSRNINLVLARMNTEREKTRNLRPSRVNRDSDDLAVAHGYELDPVGFERWGCFVCFLSHV